MHWRMEATYEDQRQKIRGPTKQQRKKKNSCAASMWTYKNPFNMIQSIEYCHLIFWIHPKLCHCYLIGIAKSHRNWLFRYKNFRECGERSACVFDVDGGCRGMRLRNIECQWIANESYDSMAESDSKSDGKIPLQTSGKTQRDVVVSVINDIDWCINEHQYWCRI